MATALHLLKGPDDLARTVIEEQVAAGDRVTVALLHDAVPPVLPAAVSVHRVPHDTSYAALLDLVFAADHVVAW